MTKKLFFAIFLIFVVVGCNISSSQKPKEIDVRVGFNGLMMEFAKNTPPQKIFEKDYFPVVLKITNNGAFGIKKENSQYAFLSLGVEKDYTKILQLQTTDIVKQENQASARFALDGKTPLNPNGDLEVISYNLQAGNVDPQSEAHISTLIATLCYPYQTILSATVCIDTDVSGTRPGKKVCKMQDLNFNSGQGAPVAATKIEVNMLPQFGSDNQVTSVRPQFLIYIENKEKGNIIKEGLERDYCTKTNFVHENLNKVRVAASLGGKELDCKTFKKGSADEKDKDNYVKLIDKKALARCVMKDSDISRTNDNYLTPLKVTLAYGYTQSVSSSYSIQKGTGQ